MKLSTTDELISEARAGRPVILVDDENRENEGDLVLAAQHVSPRWLSFMASHGRGLICLALTPERAAALSLPPMVEQNDDPNGTAFTVSVDHASNGTGISAFDRADTIRALVDPAARPSDFRRPGHVFPLVARQGGVLERAGHTEAAVDLARLAGLAEAGVICEVMGDDGRMSRLPELRRFARLHGLAIGSIAELIAYRRRQEPPVRQVAEAALPTRYGNFRMIGFRDDATGAEHLALVMGEVDEEPLLVRVHSECLTGDAFHSLRCDCGAQRDAALQAIAREGRGVLLYLRQEGRGIGLFNKIRAYALQDQGADTVEANERLGFPADARDFRIAGGMLAALRAGRLRVLTNNPSKLRALGESGLEVVERVPLEVGRNSHNRSYLDTKAEKLGHLLTGGPVGDRHEESLETT